MNVNGVLGSMCFPSMTGFCGQLFSRTPDRELGLRLLQGYNDWHIDEWCGTYPGRFMPLALVPIWDPELMAAEVRRVAAKGCRAVTFSENPTKLGYPSFHTDHWDPFWRACEETGTVVCLHIGSSSSISVTSDDAPVDVMITVTPGEPLHVRGRPDLVADLPQVPQPEDRARPRAASGGSRTSSTASTSPTSTTRRGRTRTSATSCRARCSTSTSSRASSTTRPA